MKRRAARWLLVAAALLALLPLVAIAAGAGGHRPAAQSYVCVRVEPKRIRCEARNVPWLANDWPRWSVYQPAGVNWSHFSSGRGQVVYLDLATARGTHLVVMQPERNPATWVRREWPVRRQEGKKP